MTSLDLENEIYPQRAFEPIRSIQTRTRRLDRGDHQAIEDLFIGLDRETRCRRFGHAASDESLRAHAIKALNDAACLTGIFVDGALRGVLELYSCAPAPIIEAAIVVDKGWRRRGLGHELLSQARASETQNMRLVFTRDNWPMRYLTTKMGARFDLLLDELCADIAPLARCELKPSLQRSGANSSFMTSMSA
ncbi:MAG: GNAT family N-acetyltransferase [Candidatus Sulfotelmatobacter sp.]